MIYPKRKYSISNIPTKIKGGDVLPSTYENTDTLKVEEAAQLMHKSPSFVRQGLIDKRFGFGFAVYNNKRWNYYINKSKFFEETGIVERSE